MDTATASALSALAGTIVGGLSSFLSTWAVQRSQTRWQGRAADRTRREALYGEFIDETSKVFAHSMQNTMQDGTEVVRLYALVSRMRLFSDRAVVTAADQVMRTLIDNYLAPNRSFAEMREIAEGDGFDPLETFSEACRAEARARGG